MAGPAIDALAAVAGIGCQQLLEQAGAELGHRGADRQLQRGQPFPADAERARRQLGEAGYLGREGRLKLVEEPPFSAPGPAGGASSASAEIGLASQISSLTSTSSPTRDLNRL